MVSEFRIHKQRGSCSFRDSGYNVVGDTVGGGGGGGGEIGMGVLGNYSSSCEPEGLDCTNI